MARDKGSANRFNFHSAIQQRVEFSFEKYLGKYFFTLFLTESSKWFTLSSSDIKESNSVIGFVIAKIYIFSVDETRNVDWEDLNV